MQNGTVFVTGGSLTGGDTPGAGSPLCGLLPEFCRGGPGLFVADALSFARRRDATIVTGTGPVAGLDVDAPAGTVGTWPATARGFAVTSPLRENESGELVFTGAPGDVVLLVWSTRSGFLELAAHQGVLLTHLDGLTRLLVFGGITGPGGVLTVPVTIPASLNGLEAVTLYLQAAFLGAEGDLFGPLSVLTAVDDAF